MGFLLSKLLPLLLYPLGLGLVLQLLGLAAAAKGGGQGSEQRSSGRRRASLWLSGTGVGLIWLGAMPLTSRQLIWGLAPLLVTSGGRVSFTSNDPAPPEALWARDLAQELGVPATRILINPGSRTTAEEARDIGALGRRRGWTRVLLVTSAFHMPRSLATFQQRSGLTVVPVACDYQLTDRAHYGQPTIGNTLKSVLPDAEALYLSTVALKEHLGLAVYRLSFKLWEPGAPG